MRDLPAGRSYATYLYRAICMHADRKQFFATFFLRNRPELELLRRLAEERPYGSTLKLAVMACSKGAEVYSIAWTIRSARPDLQLRIAAVDISPEIVKFAAQGRYLFESPAAHSTGDGRRSESGGSISRNTSRDQNAWMFERVSAEELDAMFEIDGIQASIRPWLRQDITWISADAGDPALRDQLGPQDIVIANRFLCHMAPDAAAHCLRNLAGFVKPAGYLFVSGVDLDVRTQVARELHWEPEHELLREIHDGDGSIRRGWPTEYWGLEPLDDRREDWQLRYASAFRVGGSRGEPDLAGMEADARYEIHQNCH
jgi:chemotaxis methyl-accepting protein methylase